MIHELKGRLDLVAIVAILKRIALESSEIGRATNGCVIGLAGGRSDGRMRARTIERAVYGPAQMTSHSTRTGITAEVGVR